jgi:hypothetical protein
MGQNPYKTTHPKEQLSVEMNFRSFLAGEGSEFFEPVPVEDLVRFAWLGCPITIPESGPYSEDELRQIASAVQHGNGELTLRGSGNYPADMLDRLEKEAPGRIRLT